MSAGWDSPLDVDHQAGEAFRVVQLTPPGSACSITIGTGISQMTPDRESAIYVHRE